MCGRRSKMAVSSRSQGKEYEEIDPDVFGEELDTPAYAAVERIAAVSLNVTVARS
jgi:hypothetical protein